MIALPPYFHLHHHFPSRAKQTTTWKSLYNSTIWSCKISLLTIIAFLKHSISHHPDIDDFFRLFRFHLAPWLWDLHGPQITNSCVSAMVARSPAISKSGFMVPNHVLNVFFPTVIVWTKEKKGIPVLLTSRSRCSQVFPTKESEKKLLCLIFFEEEGIGRWKTSLRKEQHPHDKVRSENSWTLVKCLMQVSWNYRQVQPQNHPRNDWRWISHFWDLGTNQLKPCQPSLPTSWLGGPRDHASLGAKKREGIFQALVDPSEFLTSRNEPTPI